MPLLGSEVDVERDTLSAKLSRLTTNDWMTTVGDVSVHGNKVYGQWMLYISTSTRSTVSR